MFEARELGAYECAGAGRLAAVKVLKLEIRRLNRLLGRLCGRRDEGLGVPMWMIHTAGALPLVDIVLLCKCGYQIKNRSGLRIGVDETRSGSESCDDGAVEICSKHEDGCYVGYLISKK